MHFAVANNSFCIRGFFSVLYSMKVKIRECLNGKEGVPRILTLCCIFLISVFRLTCFLFDQDMMYGTAHLISLVLQLPLTSPGQHWSKEWPSTATLLPMDILVFTTQKHPTDLKWMPPLLALGWCMTEQRLKIWSFRTLQYKWVPTGMASLMLVQE